MTAPSSSLIICYFWTHNASNILAENSILVRPSHGLEEKIKMDIKYTINIGFNPLNAELNPICPF